MNEINLLFHFWSPFYTNGEFVGTVLVGRAISSVQSVFRATIGEVGYSERQRPACQHGGNES
jgi:hypothetical protein